MEARQSAHMLAVAGVDIVTFGQYLQPTPKHLAVKEMVTPQKFEHWRKYGEDVIGFRYASMAGLVDLPASVCTCHCSAVLLCMCHCMLCM